MKRYEIAIVRYEGYEGEYESWRVVARYDTTAKSDKQAINNIRYRIGGNKNLAFIDGSGHWLIDKIEIAPKEDSGYTYDYREGVRL